MVIRIDLHIFSGWRFFVFWLHRWFSRGPHTTRLHMTLSAAHISWIGPYISCQCIVGLCCLYGGKWCFESWFGSEHCCSSLAKAGEDEGSPLSPMIGQRILSGNSTASHFCNLQINIYGSACSTGLSGSRPSGKIEERAFGGLLLSLCVELSLAGRTTQMCFVLS